MRAVRAAWAVLACLLAAGGASAHDVLAGFDLYRTPPGAAVQDFGDGVLLLGREER